MTFWDEFLHCHNVGCVFDYTAQPLPLVCIEKRIPYVGFAQTQMHLKQLTKYLIRRTWAKMVDPESDHYEPESAKILQTQKGDSVQPGALQPNAKVLPKPKANDAAARLKAMIANAKDAQGTENEEDVATDPED